MIPTENNMIPIYAERGKPLYIGRRGEENARCVVFDLSHWRSVYGPGTAQLLVQRTGEATPYPADLTVEGNRAIWTVTLADTEIPGSMGKAELCYLVNGTLAKSEIWTTIVLDALGEVSETPPEPQKAWVDQVLQIGMDAKAAAAQAKADADRAAEIATAMDKLATQVGLDAETATQAKKDAQTAQGKAETAQQAAETAQKAAEDAAVKAGTDSAAAEKAATRAENAAKNAADALTELRVLYQEMQAYVERVILAIQAEGNTQVERVAAAGTAQVNAAKTEADRSQTEADRATAARAAAEAAGYLTDARDGKAYIMAWGVSADSYPTLKLVEKEEVTE